ncbi:MAG: secretin N-terminal domain-containing protein, partial [Enterobacteriaceae bacterium]
MQNGFNKYRRVFSYLTSSAIRYCKSVSILLLLLLTVAATPAPAVEYSANFKNIDIQEFINTVSKNLNKTIIIDPAVMGKINVRSYDELNADQYYQFFLSVLEVYGFSVITMDNGLLKVIPSKNIRGAAVPVANGKSPGEGDEMISRVVPVHNVLARDMVPLLRQLSDNNGVGGVVHYDMSNMLLLTGRAEVVNNMVKVVQDIDKSSDQTVVRIPLEHASATDVAKMITTLTREDMPGLSRIPNGQFIRVVADERTNSLLVSGEEKARDRVSEIVRQLDKDAQSSNTKVIFLKYAKASSLLSVLTGSAPDSQNKNDSFAASMQSGGFGNQNQGGGFGQGGQGGLGGGRDNGNGQGLLPGGQPMQP